MSQGFAIDWFPLLPPSRIALIALVLLGLVAWGSWMLARKQIPRRSIVVLGLLRAAAVLIFVACLLQPTISYDRARQPSPELIVLIDTSASMGQSDEPAGPTRLQATTAALDRSRMLEQLGRRFDLKAFAFDRRAYPLEVGDAGVPNLTSLTAQGATTDFTTALAAADDLIAAESDRPIASAAPRRVLLVSDGNDHGSADFAAAAARAGAIVDVLPAGGFRSESSPAASPQAATVTEVQAPSRVLLASETKFSVVAARSDDPKAAYVVVLFEDGKEAAQQEFEFNAGRREQRVEISHRPTETGLKRYEFELRPKNAPAGAAPAASEDRYGVDVQVIDDKIEVLVLEDRWRWDFKYLKRVLEDDPSFHLTALLARGGNAFLQMGEPEAKANLAGFPQGRAELDRFDVIVLGDVRPTRWPAGLSGALADAVIEDGKSLVVVAGPSLGEFAQIAHLHSLLPVELSVDSAAPIEGPLDVRLTPDGARHGLFADEGKPHAGPLPGVDRIYAPLRKRPAAAVLVEAAGKANAAGALVVIAEHRVGRGRVLFVGTDALWKWQTLPAADDDGRTPYEKLWQQALRALTPERTTAGPLRVVAERSRYSSGERVVLRSELPVVGGGERRKLEASIALPDGRRLPIAFEQDGLMPDMQAAAFDAVVPGRYRITSTATVDGQITAQATTAIQVTPAGTETDDREVDRAALARIAMQTGGKVVDLTDPQTWPAPPTESLGDVTERRTVNLWDNFALLTLLCLVLGADWLIRLLRGYV